MPDVREKLVELIDHVQDYGMKRVEDENSILLIHKTNEMVTDHLIANGVTIQRWIPVTERLPEESDRYLCNVKSFAFPGKYYQAILWYDKYGFHEGNIYTDDVTHWMPLPDAPKGE